MNMNLILRIEVMVKRINRDEFDQELIASLLIAIREKLPTGSLSREISDFIAHPLLKDRGQLWASVERVNKSLIKAYDKAKNEINGRITIEKAFDVNIAIKAIEQALINIHESFIIERQGIRFEEIQACVLLLLQGSLIKVENIDGVDKEGISLAVNPLGKLCLMVGLPVPVRIPGDGSAPMFFSEIKYEIMSSERSFAHNAKDASGFSHFNGVINAKRGKDGSIIYVAITSGN